MRRKRVCLCPTLQECCYDLGLDVSPNLHGLIGRSFGRWLNVGYVILGLVGEAGIKGV